MLNGKEVTIYDIASQLDLSIATVSRALHNSPAVNKKTKKKVSDLAEKLGYRSNHFARNLRNQKTNTIGVIIPKLNSYFMSTVIAGIEHVVNSNGYNLIISQSSESIKKEIANVETMFKNRVDGLLVSLSYETNDFSHFESFLRKKIPLIFFDRIDYRDGLTSVTIDNALAAHKVTTHLIEQGCKRIVHITASSKANVYTDRLSGYKKALADHGIEFNSDLVVAGDLSQQAGAEAANLIMQMDNIPDAVFAANDNAAVGCLLELKKHGYYIPHDIAVAGFNNDPVSQVVEPNLTTVNYPGYEMGELVAIKMINHLNGVHPVQSTNQIILQSQLISRESSLKSSPGSTAS